jgi:hypothetical protein
MADLKISQLNSIITVVPATDVLPVVQGGTTLKITPNQILGSGGTATLASATITGAATVGTTLGVTGDFSVGTNALKVFPATNRVLINQSTVFVGSPLEISALTSGADTLSLLGRASDNTSAVTFRANGAATIKAQIFGGDTGFMFGTAGVTRYTIDATGVSTWSVAGTTAMTLNSTGLALGMSISSPWGTNRRVLQIGGTNSGAIALTGTSGSGELFFNSFFNSSSQNICVVTGGTGKYDFNVSTVGCHAWNIGTGTAGTAFTFTQAMTLDASGNLLVGTTTNTNSSRVFARGTGGATTLAIQSSTGDTANPGLLVGKFDNDSTTSQILVRFTINNNAGGSGQINANGASQAAFGSFSDSRLKENIVSLPFQLDNILSLRPVEFDYKDGSGHQIGFVAQEMQEVYPDVIGEQDGFLTVTGWSKTEARLVSAIKELAAKVQALEAKLA